MKQKIRIRGVPTRQITHQSRNCTATVRVAEHPIADAAAARTASVIAGTVVVGAAIATGATAVKGAIVMTEITRMLRTTIITVVASKHHKNNNQINRLMK